MFTAVYLTFGMLVLSTPGSPRCDGPCAEELIVEKVGEKSQLGALAQLSLR
jgi:hypothetical protein